MLDRTDLTGGRTEGEAEVHTYRSLALSLLSLFRHMIGNAVQSYQ